MGFPKKYFFIAFVTVALYSFALNEWNKHIVEKNNPTNIAINARSLVYNSTIASVDNEWYLPQIKNLLAGKGFTINPDKEHYDVRRTPAYPIFYGIHYLIFGEVKSFYFIRFTQILLFALATIALFFATFNFTKNKKIATVTAILYGFNPTLVSYLYFTITEALSPSLVCFLLYFLSRCYVDNQRKDWVIAGLLFATGSLCRPAVFFIAPAVFFAVIYINRKSVRNLISSGLLVTLGAGTLFAPYIIRNYMVTKGDFILLEKYYGDPMDFGMPDIELRNWISCYMNPADYSSEIISSIMLTAIAYDSAQTKEMVIDKLIQQLPARAILVNSRAEIKEAYGSLYDYYSAKNKEVKTAEISFKEKICISKMQELKNDFTQKAPFQYYIITPLLVFKSIVFQSNSSTLAMLDNYQTSLYKKVMKAILYFLNIFLFIALIGNLFYVRKYFLLYGICILFMTVSFTYITFILKYFEARYLIPLFPCMYISGVVFLAETVAIIKQRLNF